jgi:DNA-binding NarL/FixJ family response regulator
LHEAAEEQLLLGEHGMQEIDKAGVDPKAPGADDGKRRTLLVIASQHAMSRTLAMAIHTEFPWIAVERVETVDAACRHFARPVALILVEAVMLAEAEVLTPRLKRFHPDAGAAVIEADGQRPYSSLVEILRSRLVRGVLPMNLQLDVWLSIVRLMLRGGEYFPRDMLYAPRRVAPPMVANSDDRAELTQRELEVLELVSRGLQNKSIAAHLNLSEHTVKIHLHNIISKLRAHNRTEAAAWFREKLLFRDARPGNI